MLVSVLFGLVSSEDLSGFVFFVFWFSFFLSSFFFGFSWLLYIFSVSLAIALFLLAVGFPHSLEAIRCLPTRMHKSSQLHAHVFKLDLDSSGSKDPSGPDPGTILKPNIEIACRQEADKG